MPDPSTYDDSMELLEELEDTVGEEYPDVLETLGTARSQLEEAHTAMAGDEEGEEFGEDELPPDLEGEEEDLDFGDEEGLPPELEGDEEMEEEEEDFPPA